MSSTTRRLRRQARRNALLTATKAAGCTCRPDFRTVGPSWWQAAHDDDCPAVGADSQIVLYWLPGCGR